MAQTKAKAPSKRSAGTKKPQARSRGSTKNKKSENSRKPASSSKATPTEAVAHAADKATTVVGNAADKAKIPLVAGGAALAGVAGGAMLGARQARRHRSRGLAKTAKGVGIAGAQVGRLASEIHQAREAGNGKSRSPVEVVLEGLTSRRSNS
jgi:hypothetical protein